MRGKGLQAETPATLALLLCMLLGSASLQATPIRPEADTLVQQPESTSFVPARVGWEGPEPTLDPVVRNPLLESLTPERVNSDFRETVLAVAVPDLWLVVALASAILLMRGLLHMNRTRILRRQQRRQVPERLAA